MKIDYTGTGKTSEEAIDDVRQQFARSCPWIPRFIREWMLHRFGTLQLYCDGCGELGETDMSQNAYGVWGGSGGWRHIRYATDKTNWEWTGLDFCLACQVNDGMKDAIEQGRRPLGHGDGEPIQREQERP